MAYGLWLYKEIVNDTGRKTRLEIEKRDYSGQSYEITALSGDIVLSIDGGSATDPIVKSNLSFSIIDTAQVTYSDFFTPDATLYKVKVYDVSGQTQTIRWTGYITPDSFGEPLTYRGQINLTARDNLGYLNDLDFDYNNATSESYASIKNIVNAAIAKIGGMSVVWNVAKKATTQAGGTYDNIEDAIVSTYNMLGDTWGNVVSELLRGIGCQLRYIDGNAFAVYDIEVLSNSATFAAQQVRFLEQSGYREIQPAWKKAIITQDYSLKRDYEINTPTVYDGQIGVLQDDDAKVNYGATIKMRTSANGWNINRGSALSPIAWGLTSPFDVAASESRERNAIYVPFYEASQQVRLGMYAEKSITMSQSEIPFDIVMMVSPAPRASVWTYSGNPPYNIVTPLSPITLLNWETSSKKFYYNILFITDGGTTYYLRNTWMSASDIEENPMVQMALPDSAWYNESQDIELKVTVMSTPASGRLVIRIYPPDGEFSEMVTGDRVAYGVESCVRIREISLSVSDDGDVAEGRSRQGSVNSAHNVINENDYVFGQIPANTYGIEFYKGGIYKNNTTHTPYSHFKRNSGASEVDNLLDLIGRETIQYHKKSWDILSGTVQVVDRTSVMRFGTFMYGGKRYLPISAALNLLANQMSVTSMLEIENYVEEAGITFSDYVGKSTSGKSGGGGGSSSGLGYTAWGNITGNIDNQADLKEKLDERPTSELFKRLTGSFVTPPPASEMQEGDLCFILTNVEEGEE